MKEPCDPSEGTGVCPSILFPEWWARPWSSIPNFQLEIQQQRRSRRIPCSGTAGTRGTPDSTDPAQSQQQPPNSLPLHSQRSRPFLREHFKPLSPPKTRGSLQDSSFQLQPTVLALAQVENLWMEG